MAAKEKKEEVPVYEVESILEVALEPDGTAKFLTRWKEYDDIDMSWEPVSSFNNAKEFLQEYIEKFNGLHPLRKITVFNEDAMEKLENDSKMDKLFERKFIANGWRKPKKRDDEEKENKPKGTHDKKEKNLPPTEKKSEMGIILDNITKAYDQVASGGKRPASNGIYISAKRARLDLAYDFHQENLEQEETCIFCKKHKSSVLCRKFRYYNERREVINKENRCFKCMGTHKPYHEPCLAAVLVCRICDGNTHVTAMCNQNNIVNWH